MERWPIREVAMDLGLRLYGHGSTVRVMCPKGHDWATPSLVLYDDHGHCFGCGWHPDAPALVAAVTGASRAKARMWLSSGWEPADPCAPRDRDVDMTHRLLELRHSWNRAGVSALVQRQWPGVFTPEALASLGLVTSERHLLVPHWVERGGEWVVSGIKTRDLTTGEKGAVKGSVFTLGLYHPLPYWRWCGKVWIVEGESDTWALMTHEPWRRCLVLGLPAGAGTVREEWFRGAVGCVSELCIATDADDAGERAAAAIMDVAARLRLPASRHRPVGKDWAESIGRRQTGGQSPQAEGHRIRA